MNFFLLLLLNGFFLMPMACYRCLCIEFRFETIKTIFIFPLKYICCCDRQIHDNALFILNNFYVRNAWNGIAQNRNRLAEVQSTIWNRFNWTINIRRLYVRHIMYAARFGISNLWFHYHLRSIWWAELSKSQLEISWTPFQLNHYWIKDFLSKKC